METSLKKIQTVQNGLLKFLFNKRRLHVTNSLHHEIKILKLKDIFDLSISLLVHDCLHGKCPSSFTYYFTRKRSRSLRQVNKLELPRSRLTMGQSRIECRGPNIWNGINITISSLTERNPFKNELITDKLNRYLTEN